MQQRQQYEQQLQQQNYFKQKQMAQQKMMQQQQQLHLQQQQMMKVVNINHSSTLNGKNGDARKSDGEENEEEGVNNDNRVEGRNGNFPQHSDGPSAAL